MQCTHLLLAPWRHLRGKRNYKWLWNNPCMIPQCNLFLYISQWYSQLWVHVPGDATVLLCQDAVNLILHYLTLNTWCHLLSAAWGRAALGFILHAATAGAGAGAAGTGKATACAGEAATTAGGWVAKHLCHLTPVAGATFPWWRVKIKLSNHSHFPLKIKGKGCNAQHTWQPKIDGKS